MSKSKSEMTPLTQARLKELLAYDPSTGELVWKRITSNRVQVGAIAGVIGKNGHRYITINRRHFGAHRLVWLYVYGFMPSCAIDHKNGRPADNRIENLRLCDSSQNGGNMRRPKHNTTGLKGATFHRGAQRFMAQIVVRGKRYYLGLYPSAEEAHAAYCEAAHKFHGEFARFA